MKNKLFQLGDSLLRILDSSGDLVLVIDCAKQTMPVWISVSDIALYKPISEENLANVIGNIPELETLDNEQIRTMHERYTMIVPIIPYIGDLKLRPCRIAEVSEEYKISKQSIRSYLCKYLSYMDMLALAPKGKNNDKELSVDEKNMRWGLNKFFYTQKKNSLHTAYTLMLKEKYCDPTGTLVDTYPSFYQFRYFYRKTKKMQNYYISRNGLKDYQKNNRPLLGDGVQEYAPAPGTGMVDATICDIYLVNEAGELVGRPVLTVCVDAFSGLIMGYSLTWEGGTYSLRNLMLNVIADKVEHCRNHGITISENEWPSSVLPAKIVSDQGTEYVGDTFGQIVELGVMITNLPAYRPELKGPAEKTFDMIQERFIPHLKGKGVIEPDYRERGSRDYRKDARLTMKQFEQVVIRCILFCNAHRVVENYPFTKDMIAAGVKPYATDIWRWGLNLPNCNLIDVDDSALVFTLMPRTEGKFSRYGLKVNGARYSNKDYTERYLSGGTGVVAYNPENSNHVWLIDNGRYVRFDAIESRFKDMGFEQIEELRNKQRNIILSEMESSLQAEIDLSNHIEAVVSATSRQQDVQIKKIRQTRRKEQEKVHKDFTKEAKLDDWME